MCKLAAKGKGKVPPGCLLAETVTYLTRFFMPLGARLWHYAAKLHTLSVTYPLCGLAFTDTTDNPSEMCPLKLTGFCLFLYHQSGRLFPQWRSQVVMAGVQTGYPQMGEQAL